MGALGTRNSGLPAQQSSKWHKVKTIFAIRPISPIRDKNLAAEATPWLQPRCHREAAASGHAMTLRFKAGRALDAQEAVPDLFGDGRPSNAD